MEKAAREIRSCLASLEEMIERAKRLIPEFDALRKADFEGPDPSDLANAISFPEVRELDLLCKGALDRYSDAYPEFSELASHWYVHESTGTASPEGLHMDLMRKRTVLKHALNATTGQPEPDLTEDPEEPDGNEKRWPTLLGHIQFVPRSLGIIADIGGGIAVILLASHWAFGLL